MEFPKMNCCSTESGKAGCKCVPIFVVIFAIFGIIYLGVLIRNGLRSYDYIGKTPDTINQITVSGTAKVSATPDIAVLNLGIVSEGKTVAEAEKGVTDKMNSIVKALKSDFQVDEKDIQTAGYNISPKYDWSSGKQSIIGYSVDQSVTVKVRDFTKTGDILSKATALGANSVSGPTFSIDDTEKVKAQVREQAIAEAKDKASTLAKQIGIKLGRVVNFSEGGSEIANRVYAETASGAGIMLKADTAPTIEAGSQEVQLTVNLTYEIN